MNAYEIENNPQVNGGIKRIIKERTHTEVDVDNHEIRRVVVQDSFTDREPDYVKIYTDCQLIFNHLNTALSPYIIAFGHYMTYANFPESQYRCTVRTGRLERMGVSEMLGVSDISVKKAVETLIKSEIFIPIYIDGKKQRGIYFVNPWVMSKGEWKDIKELRSGFEFISQAASTLMIDSEGNRKVIMPLTIRNSSDKKKSSSKISTVQEPVPESV